MRRILLKTQFSTLSLLSHWWHDSPKLCCTLFNNVTHLKHVFSCHNWKISKNIKFVTFAWFSIEDVDNHVSYHLDIKAVFTSGQYHSISHSKMFYKRNILRKHPQIAKKCIQSLKNRNFCYFFQFLLKGLKQNSLN